MKTTFEFIGKGLFLWLNTDECPQNGNKCWKNFKL